MCVWIPDLAPVPVILNTVNRQGNHLHTSFLEFIADPSGTGELSGADRSEVLRVGEQDTPSTEENRHKGEVFVCNFNVKNHIRKIAKKVIVS